MAHLLDEDPLDEFPPIKEFTPNPNDPPSTFAHMIAAVHADILQNNWKPKISYLIYLGDVLETFFYKATLQISRLPETSILDMNPGEVNFLKMPEPEEGSQFAFKAKIINMGHYGIAYYSNEVINKEFVQDFTAAIVKGSFNICTIATDPNRTKYPDEIKRREWLKVVGKCRVKGFFAGDKMPEPMIELHVMMHMRAMGPIMKEEYENWVSENGGGDSGWAGTAGLAGPSMDF